jgi:hypothetical protein
MYRRLIVSWSKNFRRKFSSDIKQVMHELIKICPLSYIVIDSNQMLLKIRSTQFDAIVNKRKWYFIFAAFSIHCYVREHIFQPKAQEITPFKIKLCLIDSCLVLMWQEIYYKIRDLLHLLHKDSLGSIAYNCVSEIWMLSKAVFARQKPVNYRGMRILSYLLLKHHVSRRFKCLFLSNLINILKSDGWILHVSRCTE